MKHTRILLVFILIIFLQAHTKNGHAQPSFAKLGTTITTGHPALGMLEHFQNSLNEQLTIQIFPDAQLGSAQQIMEGLQFGDIEMGILPLESVSRRAPALSMLGLPYLFRNDVHRAQVLDGPLGKQFLEDLDKLNLVGLGFLETCSRAYVSKDQALNTPEAFKGRAIALICPSSANACQNQTDELSLQSLKFMGARPIIVSSETLEESLKTEKPDAIEYLPFIGMERRFQGSEFNILTLPAHRTIPAMLIAGKRWFDTLPPHTREALVRASNTLVRQQKRALKEALRNEYDMLQAQGIKVAEDENEELQQAARALYEKMPEQFGPGFEIFFHAVQEIGGGMK